MPRPIAAVVAVCVACAVGAMLVLLYQRGASENSAELAPDHAQEQSVPALRPEPSVVQQPAELEGAWRPFPVDSPSPTPSLNEAEVVEAEDKEPRRRRLWELRLPTAEECPDLWHQLDDVERETCLQGGWEARRYLRAYVFRWYANEGGPEPSEAICTLYLRAILQQPLVDDTDLRLYGTWMIDMRAVLERLSGGGPTLDAEVLRAREHWRSHGRGRRYVNTGHGQRSVTNGGDVFDRYTSRCARQIFDDTARLRWWIEHLRSMPDGPADLLRMAMAADAAAANSKPRPPDGGVLLWIDAETDTLVSTCDACMAVVADCYDRRVSTLGFDPRGLVTRVEPRDRAWVTVGLNRLTTPTPAVGVWSWIQPADSQGKGVRFLLWMDRILIWPNEAGLSGVLSAFVELDLITSADYFNSVPPEAPAPLLVSAEFTP